MPVRAEAFHEVYRFDAEAKQLTRPTANRC